MTPAVKLAKKAKIAHKTHEYKHDSNAESYGLEAAEKMAVTADRIFKTLVVDVGDKKLVVAVVPVTAMLNLKAIAKAAKAKKKSAKAKPAAAGAAKRCCSSKKK